MAPPATISDLENIFGNIISFLLAGGALSLLIMLIVTGFRFLTSGGDNKTLESAKNTFTYAIAGFIILSLSYIIIKIIEGITGIQGLTIFKITK